MPALAVEPLNTVIDLYQKKHAEMFADPRYKFLEQQTQQLNPGTHTLLLSSDVQEVASR